MRRSRPLSFLCACALLASNAHAQEPFARSVAALSMPFASRGFLVRPNELFNGEWRLTISVAPAPVTSESAARDLRFDPDGVPIGRWEMRSPSVAWNGSIAVLAEPAPADTALVASVQVTARNTGKEAQRVKVTFSLERPESLRAFTAFDAGLTPGEVRPDSLVNGWSTVPEQGKDALHGALVQPGRAKSFRVLIPSIPLSRRRLEVLSRVAHEQFVARTRRYWRGRWGEGTQLELHDPLVETAYREALTVLLCACEKRGDAWLPIGGPFQYRDVWLRDGARAVVALSTSGYTQLARRLASGLLAYQWPQGFFLSQRGQPDGTGQALWALGETYLRGKDENFPKEIVDAALRAWRWYERQRRYENSFAGSLEGMQPFANPNDNEGAKAQLVGTDFWAIAGYRATRRLCARSGRGLEADSVARALSDYQADIVAAMEASHHPDIPASWQGCGRDWGNLTAVYPCGVVAPHEPRMERLARRVWGFAGGAGLCAYGDPDSLQYYVGSDLGMWALLAHLPAAADSVLDAMLYWRTATGGAPELFSRSRRNFGDNLPPHSTGAAALVTLIRNALVCDVDDTLRLTLGARLRWWRAGAAVHGAPTRWGNVSVRFVLEDNVASWQWTPVPVWTEVTLPVGLEAESGSTLDGSPQTFRFPAGTSHAEVTVHAIGT